MGSTIRRAGRLLGYAVFVSILCGIPAWAQAQVRLGTMIPAGGQRGTSVEVMLAGRGISSAYRAIATGDGVRVEVIEGFTPVRPQQVNRFLVRRRVDDQMRNLRGESFAGNRGFDRSANAEELANHPLLRKLDQNPTIEDLQRITYEFLSKRQHMRPLETLAESLFLEIAIDADATPGDRELRLVTPRGLSNPVVFQVGIAPEILELEPNDPGDSPDLKPLQLPVVINGRIYAGDVDRFAFQAKRGQHLVVDARARRLVPYVADAVPGWFEAVITLYDADGKQIASADCYRFDPDPILLFETPRDGRYTLEIRDSLYRGRQDFIYRVSISEQPLVTSVFPLGGRQGVATTARIGGVNLPTHELTLDTRPGPGVIRETSFCESRWLPHTVRYAVDSLPECRETEPNGNTENAQNADRPLIINGLIDTADDVDVFRFDGIAGEEVVIDVMARRLNSPLDSLIRLSNASGKELARNDDHPLPNIGLQTHHADSYLKTTLPKSGTYFVHLCDAQQHGGPAYGYRLRVTSPRPGFSVWVAPSSVNVSPGQTVPLYIRVLRKDGFDGQIDLRLKGAPQGFVLGGAIVPEGQDSVTCTLTAPTTPFDSPTALHMEGTAGIDGRTVVCRATAADQWQQAFVRHHLVAAQDLMAQTTRSRMRSPDYQLSGRFPVSIRPGDTIRVELTSRMRQLPRETVYKLLDAPKGITLEDVKTDARDLSLTFEASADAAEQLDSAGNLIVELYMEMVTRFPGGSTERTQMRSIGTLPANPVQGNAVKASIINVRDIHARIPT